MYTDNPNSVEDTQGLSDEQLIDLVQQGNRGAFSALYERYLPIVYRRVRYRVPERDVEDVTQEIFISVMKSLERFKGDSQFSTWLRTLVQRRIADYYRRQPNADTMLDEDIGDLSPNLGGLSVGAETGMLEDRIALRRGLRELPAHYQEIILLRFVEGLQFSEIAQERDQSLEATKSLFRRAMSALREQMRQPDV